MGYEELVDTLIAEGHKEVSLCSNTRRTDDDDILIKEYLILDAGGDIVARKLLLPARYSWSMVGWSGAPSGNSAPLYIKIIDLQDAATAKTHFLLLT